MEEKSPRPRVVISRCIEFAACRYDGETIRNKRVSELKDSFDFVTVCPEDAIGMGVPREPVCVVEEGGKEVLFQPSTGKEYTKEMKAYVKGFLDSLGEVDGFILKAKSPTCGVRRVKRYKGREANAPFDYGSGFLASEVLERFSDVPIADETQLSEEFLERVRARARARRKRS